MRLKQKPPFTGNSRGHCSLYAIANVLHGFPNAQKAFEKFPKRSSGYMVTEQAEMVSFISSESLKLAVLYYAPGHFCTESLFRQLCPYKEYADEVFTELPGKVIFAPLLFAVYTGGGEMHAISAYYSFDSDVLICMDSSGKGSITLQEPAQFFQENKVYGISAIVQQEEETGAYYTALFEREELKIYEP